MSAKILERQNIVREWWRHNRLTRAMLAFQAARFNEPVHIQRWTDMQARLACYDHGSALANDQLWQVIQAQLSYPALWVAKNWHLQSIKKLTTKMEVTYHILVKKNNRITLTPLALIQANIRADETALYEWLGIIGGHIESDPADLV